MSNVPGPTATPTALHLVRWKSRPIAALALAALASGFGQFGVVAALGDVARGFGAVHHGATFADQAGLSGTVLGIGLAVIRLASLGSLPVSGLADRFGRRTMLLIGVGAGLALTVLAAASPGYWWFVAIFAAGRPLLSAATGLSQVMAAEQTASADRAKAVAVVAAGYAVGAGLIAIVHSLATSALGFRGVFALALAPLALLPLLRRWTVESERFTHLAGTPAAAEELPVLGAVAPQYRKRLAIVAAVAFALSLVTGPANSFVFLYAQNVRHQPGGVVAGMVAGAGVAGFGGLLAGRWLADHVGRRATGSVAMAGIAGAAVLTYTGSSAALLVGYVLGITAGAVFAPAIGALVNELFPTQVRASVAGWVAAAGVLGAVAGLVEFGAVVNGQNRFALAAVVTFLPPLVGIGGLWMVPETRGREPEDLWITI